MTAVSISRSEWRRVVIFALVVVINASLPYAVAWLAQPDDWTFSGFLIGVDDGNSYLGKMRLGARGVWDFYLFYSPEPTQGEPLVFLPYVIPGQIVGRIIGADSPALIDTLLAVFHAMRIAFGFLLVVVLYRFIAVFVRSPQTRFFALVLATLGGGLGWLLLLFGSLPPEFYIPEGFTFVVLFTLPHVALARSMLLIGLLALCAALVHDHWKSYAVIAGVCWLLVGIAVPFYFVILYCILGAWGLALWIKTRTFPLKFAVRGITATAITLPLFGYYTYIFSANDAYAQWSAQNLLPSPNPLHYTLSYAPLAVLSYVGARWAWRRASTEQSRYALLDGWVLIVPLLVYLPINVQRRMAEAVIVPLAILAAAGGRLLAARGSNYLRSWRRTRLYTLVLTVPTTLLLVVVSLLAVLSPARPIYRENAELAAFTWLDTSTNAGAVVMGTIATGNMLAARTNLRVFYGHGPETLNSKQKEADVPHFYDGTMTATERAALYQEFDIRYIFYGPEERDLAESPAAMAWMNGLNLVYDTDGYQIYEVNE